MHNILMWFSKGSIDDPEQYFLCTYHNEIIKRLPTTYYTSDSGWGCMLRVTQMAIANLLFKWEKLPIRQLLPLFWDNSDQNFSIQRLTEASKQLFTRKAQYEWFSPSEGGFLLKQLLEQYDPTYSVNIANGNCLFLKEIDRSKPKIVVLLMCMIGLEIPQEKYLQTVLSIMKCRFFGGLMGGTPKHAHLFMKVCPDNRYLGYLDPHTTARAEKNIQEMDQQQYTCKLQWIKKQRISSSMCIVLRMVNQEVEEMWATLEAIKENNKDGFYLSLGMERPEYDEGGIIEIIDDSDEEEVVKK